MKECAVCGKAVENDLWTCPNCGKSSFSRVRKSVTEQSLSVPQQSMKPLAISEHLRLLMIDGQPFIHSSYGYNPLQIAAEVRKWQEEDPYHPRFPDSVLWLNAYQPQIDALSERQEENRFQDSLQEVLQTKKKKTEREIEHGRKRYGDSREIVENNEKLSIARLLEEVRLIVQELGYSGEEAYSRAVGIVRELFHDLGYSDEETDDRVIAALKAAKVLFTETSEDGSPPQACP